jgi:hypothetical protein
VDKQLSTRCMSSRRIFNLKHTTHTHTRTHAHTHTHDRQSHNSHTQDTCPTGHAIDCLLRYSRF